MKRQGAKMSEGESDFLLCEYYNEGDHGLALGIYSNCLAPEQRYVAYADDSLGSAPTIIEFEPVRLDDAELAKLLEIPPDLQRRAGVGSEWIDVFVVSDKVIVDVRHAVWKVLRSDTKRYVNAAPTSYLKMARICDKGASDGLGYIHLESFDAGKIGRSASNQFRGFDGLDPETAVAARLEQLERLSATEFPLEWGRAQLGLGDALVALDDQERGGGKLERAIAAFRHSLGVFTRHQTPFEWAAAQNKLGNAFAILGEREAGTAWLEEAVVAYRAALEEQTRERVPLDWAMTQNNLGHALWTLGEREAGTARLEEAVVAYRAALEERTRGRVPLDWTMTQNNLGSALHTLGERKAGTARLKEAVVAYRAALEEWTRERAPFPWAQTMENLAMAHRTLFERTESKDDLNSALAAVDEALEVYREEQAPYYINKATALREHLLAARHDPPPGGGN